MSTQLDSFTIKNLESRYGVARSNIYNRIDGLKKKGFALEPEKQQGKSVFNADQIALMDQLDTHLKGGGTIADFGNSGISATSETSGISPRSDRPTGQVEPSYKTQDMLKADAASIPFGMGAVIDAIAAKVVEILSFRQTTQLAPPLIAPSDPLANLRALEEAYEKGWLLSSSQLAPLVGLKSLHGKAFDRFGFRFTKVGRNGAEAAWKITKAN
ncbi:MAG TPA: hypothetical protein V6C65_28450 [Allocoleopsis sp.]